MSSATTRARKEGRTLAFAGSNTSDSDLVNPYKNPDLRRSFEEGFREESLRLTDVQAREEDARTERMSKVDRIMLPLSTPTFTRAQLKELSEAFYALIERIEE